MSPDEKYRPCYENWTETLPNCNMSINGFLQNRLHFNNVDVNYELILYLTIKL